MASFDEHISQAKKNLDFLDKVNSNCVDFWDWQVTICFYVAVHLANAHIAKKSNSHYRTHSEVKEALNPEKILSITKFKEEEFISYVKLMNLSRRARYLCHDSTTNHSINGHFTYDVHFAKALKNLNKLLLFFESEYKIHFQKINVTCIPYKEENSISFFNS